MDPTLRRPLPLSPVQRRTLVLHALRLEGLAGIGAVATRTGLPPGEVAAEMDRAATAGAVRERRGALSGWQLTAAGRVELRALLADELDRSGARPRIEAVYARFAPANAELLELCTRWQLRPGPDGPRTNHHDDAAYDAGVVADLGAFHLAVTPMLDALAAGLDRYGRYRPQLTEALERVRGGELDLFTKPGIASYHTVWFELHEDLLATLGIERASEAP